MDEAKQAYENGYEISQATRKNRTKKESYIQESLSLFEDTSYIEESICVDAACSGNPGPMEYKGVYTKTGKELFHFGPIPGTNNIGEFLAIVHGLGFLKQHNVNLPIYSDSQIAIKWVKLKKANTSLPRNKEYERVWNLTNRAEKWLQNNEYDIPILKWDTDRWGEIKADFGRKGTKSK